MTAFDLGFVGVRLLGIWCGLTGLYSFGTSGWLWFAVAPSAFEEDGGVTSSMATLWLLAGVVSIGLAVLCFARTGALAKRLLPASSSKTGPITRGDLFTAAFAAVGALVAVEAIPWLVTFLIQIVWYLEGSRQALFTDFATQNLLDAGQRVLIIAVGAALVVKAPVLGKWLAARGGAESQPDRRGP